MGSVRPLIFEQGGRLESRTRYKPQPKTPGRLLSTALDDRACSKLLGAMLAEQHDSTASNGARGKLRAVISIGPSYVPS